ncbi:UbiA prenyltransferase family protein [Gaetbulibacter saemankumensis]|uniref:membrane protein n=1 Tax=Gaetbulibacter saemankumensis TaxID=311208 RepID=UPI0003F81F5F|nr:membrane protein [Gaetbulibacter saemankumensis]
MKLFYQVFNFYINSSIHVALAVVSLTWITLLDYNISLDVTILMFVMFSAITGYNFVKYFGLAKFHHRSLANRLKNIQIFSMFCFIAMCYFGFRLQFKTLICISVFAVVTFFYAVPFLPRNLFLDNRQNLRNIGGLKVYLIALVWAGVTVLLPLVNNDFEISVGVLLTVIQRYAFIIVLMLPFEIRDLKYDSLKLATIPQTMGIRRTKIMGGLLLILVIILEFFRGDFQSKHLLVLSFVALTTWMFLKFSKVEQSAYYCSFWVEGIPILWFLIYVLFN